MNRLDRLTALLIQLQSKRIVKSQEVAERFGISLRTVYRDIRTLELAGVPLIGEAGIGYSIMQGYRLPPVQFTREEAMSFVTAEKLVNKLTDPETRTSYQSALYKIKSVLRSTDKELLDDLSDRIAVVDDPYLPKDRHQMSIETILNCISEKKVIRLHYISMTSPDMTERIIEPVGIYSSGAYWYLIAWCRLREGYRNFRTDRVQSMEVLSERFETLHPALQSFIERTRRERTLHKAVIRLDRVAQRYLGDHHYYNGFVSQTDAGDQIEMTFLTESLNGLAHWFVWLGQAADIVEPEELKELVLEKLEKTRQRLLTKVSEPC
ncbi:helix-turn-helix transcriptional regulator [Salmonirosea aquatica]|uniref:WYL domain-containing protein n=1 Tax=Salmonirosea aquatica TaxID=2654236 RepID=A0A7C9FWZ0_9BACT|nr:WYL domain-containing protein [Cytophagaceae bacterium SJW1-29]